MPKNMNTEQTEINEIETLKNELSKLPVGSEILVEGYTTDGHTCDRRVVLMGGDDNYKTMLEQDLRILREADEADLLEEAAAVGFLYADLMAARDALIESKAKSLAQYENDEVPSRARYDHVEGSVYVKEGNEGFYLKRLRDVGDIPPARPAKGAIPKAKQYISSKLNLPSNRYCHILKIEEGKFKSVTTQGSLI